ncbi:MAG: hypothetical protein AB1798_20930, partial [Spirochaetota bacterium]
KIISSGIISMFSEAVTAVYPQVDSSGMVSKRIENAFKDTFSFYRLTDPLSIDNRKKAFERDSKGHMRKRLLIFFHPFTVPEHIDYMNLSHTRWLDPCLEYTQKSESFYDLYEEALNDAVPVIQSITETLSGNTSLAEIATMVGNNNLSNGMISSPCKPRYSDPLPLNEVIETVYRQTARLFS